MKKIFHLSTEYITSSRSIEILTIPKNDEQILVYVYNFEGTHFRFFDSILGLLAFFENGNESEISFSSEQELEKFMEEFGSGDFSPEFNLKLNYRYRDAGNYKQFGSIVFRNKSRLSIDEATNLIQKKLISGEFFVPKDWNLLALYYYPYDRELDHDYHEFESWEESFEIASDNRDVSDFLKEIQIGI